MVAIGGQLPDITAQAGKPKQEADFSIFDEILDIVNPLQHIPVISYIYQQVTSDAISSFANIVGGGLYGGIFGAGMALANEIADKITQPAAPEALVKYEKMRVTTADWLNPNFTTTLSA